jgi:hypothetical protein
MKRSSPKFTRRHYEATAALICNMDVLTRDACIQQYIAMFSKDNPRFSRERFIEACVPPVIEVTAEGKRALMSGGRG